MGFIHSISQIKKKSTLSEEKAFFKIRESRKVENKNANTVDLHNEKVYIAFQISAIHALNFKVNCNFTSRGYPSFLVDVEVYAEY